LLQSASLILPSVSRISQNQNAHFSRGCYSFSLRANILLRTLTSRAKLASLGDAGSATLGL
jgi:uncharacterized membrane protein YjdF